MMKSVTRSVNIFRWINYLFKEIEEKEQDIFRNGTMIWVWPGSSNSKCIVPREKKKMNGYRKNDTPIDCFDKGSTDRAAMDGI